MYKYLLLILGLASLNVQAANNNDASTTNQDDFISGKCKANPAYMQDAFYKERCDFITKNKLAENFAFAIDAPKSPELNQTDAGQTTEPPQQSQRFLGVEQPVQDLPTPTESQQQASKVKPKDTTTTSFGIFTITGKPHRDNRGIF